MGGAMLVFLEALVGNMPSKQARRIMCLHRTVTETIETPTSVFIFDFLYFSFKVVRNNMPNITSRVWQSPRRSPKGRGDISPGHDFIINKVSLNDNLLLQENLAPCK
jgi:hypothetical protein